MQHDKPTERCQTEAHDVESMYRGPYEGVQVPYLPTVLLEDGQLGPLRPALPRVPVRVGDPCAQCGVLEHCREHRRQGEHSQSSSGQIAQRQQVEKM